MKLMEREGSGYDKIYETLLANGKQLPETIEGEDSVTVIVRKKIIKTEIISFLNRINAEYTLNQKETICLSLIAQYNSLSALELAKLLGLTEQSSIKNWLGRLPEYDMVGSRGKTKGTEYFVHPNILQKTQFRGKTTLKGIESHRLRELIYKDLSTYPNSPISEIHERIGKEITLRKVRTLIAQMKLSGELRSSGSKRGTKYSVANIDIK
jgi:ATP-dependent DNA helicase RecG